MNLLPKWRLTGALPSVNDFESATAIEMVAKVYNAMNGLVNEYNEFADQINKDYTEFKESGQKEITNFKETVEERICCKFNDLDASLAKIKNDLVTYTNDYLAKVPALPVVSSYDNTKFMSVVNGAWQAVNLIDKTLLHPGMAADAAEVGKVFSEIEYLQKRISNIIQADEATEGNAELIDIRFGFDGNQYDTAGDAVRAQGVTLAERIESSANLCSAGELIKNPEIKFGYYKFADGVETDWSDDNKYAKAKLQIPVGSTRIDHNFVGIAEAGWCLLDERGTYIRGGQEKVIYPEGNARYIVLSDYKNNAVHNGLFVAFTNETMNMLLDCGGIETPEMLPGYVDQNGVVSDWGGDGRYARTDYIRIRPNALSVETNMRMYVATGWATYDENKKFLRSGAEKKVSFRDGEKYIVFSDAAEAGKTDHENKTITWIGGLIQKKIEESKGTVISCFGDSVTEGYGVEDANYAEYGGNTYPAHLKTLLEDNGHECKVYNYGHGGERTTDICARIGTRICAYIENSVFVPAGTSEIVLGETSVNNGVVTSPIVSTAKNVNGTQAGVLFTKRVNPVQIGDRFYNLTTAGNKITLYPRWTITEDFTIPAFSPVVTGGTVRNADVCIIYMGINDIANLTLEEWIDRCKSVVEVNPKTVIVGATNGNWNYWNGMEGTEQEKREKYMKACLTAFGSYYVDLFDVFTTKRCIDIATSAGYLNDRTAEQIAADNAAIANRTVPPSLTHTGVSTDPHMNTAGYYVIAKTVYDRLIQLNIV